MLKQISIFFFTLTSSAQILHHQSIASLGNSVVTSKGVRVSQSVGLQSVTGTASGTFYTLQQGFQQSLLFKDNIKLTSVDVVSKVFPNPFISTINFEFSSELKGEIEVSFFDGLGRNVYSTKTSMNQNRVTISHLVNLPEGHYFVNLSAVNFKFSTKLIKLNR